MERRSKKRKKERGKEREGERGRAGGKKGGRERGRGETNVQNFSVTLASLFQSKHQLLLRVGSSCFLLATGVEHLLGGVSERATRHTSYGSCHRCQRYGCVQRWIIG